MITGTVGVDRPTGLPADRVRSGDIALINHPDLDRPAAGTVARAKADARDQPEASPGTVVAVAVATVVAMAVGVAATTVGGALLDHLALWWDRLFGVL